MVLTWLLNIWRHFYGRFNKYGFHFVVRLFKIDHRWLQNGVKTKIKVAHDIMISSFAIGMNLTWQWRHNCFRSKLLSTRCEMSNARSPPCARKYALKGKNLFISTSVYAVIPSQIYTSLRDFRLSNAEDQGVQLRRSRGSGSNYIRDAHPPLK